MAINWDTTKAETRLIHKIGKRAAAYYLKIHKTAIDLVDMEMDITATHLNGNPLDLQKLFKADNFNLMHDVIGIMNCIDRTTGKLTKGFSPRCSA